MINGETLTRKPKHHAVHNGAIIGIGFVCPTEKKNHALMIIRGIWRIRRCDECGDVFSKPSDLVVSQAVPSDDVVRAFAEEEGVPVSVESAT